MYAAARRSGSDPQTPPARAPEPPASAGPANRTWERLAMNPHAPLAHVQATLEIGPVDDPLEREADRVAAQVVGGGAAPEAGVRPGAVSIRRCPNCPAGGRCAGCEEEGQRTVQAKGDPAATTGGPVVPRAYLSRLSGQGAPLPRDVREEFEPRFGRDFGGVRVHADAEAARAAHGVGARAFTYGRDIVFGAGQLQPGTTEGRTLLAHELVHTVQQGESPRAVQRKPITSADLKKQKKADVDKFMRKVYDEQVAIWTARGASYFEGLPKTDLVTIPSSDSLPKRRVELESDAWTAHVQPMLAAARAALAADQAAGVASAKGVTDLRIRSGYRSAREQLSIWEREFPNYLKDTRKHRKTLPGGEFGADAARYLAGYINDRVFSPGYSPHQRGKTVDVTYEQGGAWAEADSDPAAIAVWRASWFFTWLSANGARFDLFQNPALNEPWHWELRPKPKPQPQPSMLDRILQLLDRILELIRRIFGGASDETADQSPAPDYGDTPRPAEPLPGADGGEPTAQ